MGTTSSACMLILDPRFSMPIKSERGHEDFSVSGRGEWLEWNPNPNLVDAHRNPKIIIIHSKPYFSFSNPGRLLSLVIHFFSYNRLTPCLLLSFNFIFILSLNFNSSMWAFLIINLISHLDVLWSKTLMVLPRLPRTLVYFPVTMSTTWMRVNREPSTKHVVHLMQSYGDPPCNPKLTRSTKITCGS